MHKKHGGQTTDEVSPFCSVRHLFAQFGCFNYNYYDDEREMVERPASFLLFL